MPDESVDPQDSEAREREKREKQERKTEGPGDDSAVDQDPAEAGTAAGVAARASKPTG
jgi:hypothetical protein